MCGNAYYIIFSWRKENLTCDWYWSRHERV